MWKAIFFFSLYIVFYFISDRSTIIPRFNHKPTIKYPHFDIPRLPRVRVCSSSLPVFSFHPRKQLRRFFVLRVAVFKISANVPRQATNNGTAGYHVVQIYSTKNSVPAQPSAMMQSLLCSYHRNS